VFKVMVTYRSGKSDLAELPDDEANDALGQAAQRMATGDVVDVVAWEV
jgi:hypothetical protein